MSNLNWKTPIYNGNTLSSLFCRSKLEGKTLEEITDIFASVTGRTRKTLKGPLRIANMRHEWLVKGWQDNTRPDGIMSRSSYAVAKKNYIDEYMKQGGEVHPDVHQTIRNYYGGEYFPL